MPARYPASTMITTNRVSQPALPSASPRREREAGTMISTNQFRRVLGRIAAISEGVF